MNGDPALPDPAVQAALAAHRFGLGEATLQAVGGDARDWLLQQIGPAEAQRGEGLASGVQAVRKLAQIQRDLIARRRRSGDATPAASASASAPAAMPDGALDAGALALRQAVQDDVRARLLTAALSRQPFNERLALFWANHFTVSAAKAGTRGLVGAYEREAIRPHIGGRFFDLLRAAVLHAGMLRYLDNDSSAGPDSRLVRRLARRARTDGEAGPRISGLNENLAREVLELHTLGVSGGYRQADVTALARVLTGWRVPQRELLAEGAEPLRDSGVESNRAPGAESSTVAGAASVRFDPAWHQPGPKTVLGKTYAEGPQALDAVLLDLARHPATARFIATKLARHFVADDPPLALVARLAADFQRSDGDLAGLARTLVHSPEAWLPQPAKLKSPEEFVISSARLLGLGEQALARQPDAGIQALGQRVQAAPSPAGWPDRAEEWLGPDAVWKRVEWATRVAARTGRSTDARSLAAASLGPLLQAGTRQQIERAADGPQALALLLLAPEFQRR